MAIAMKGLKVRPQYEDLIGVAKPDGLENVKCPNRSAKCLREGSILSQLDGENKRQMQLQREQASKETCKDHLLKQASDATGVNISDLRQSPNAETHKLIELTPCLDQHNSQKNRLKLVIKVVTQHISQMNRLKFIKVATQHNSQMNILKLFTKVVSQHNCSRLERMSIQVRQLLVMSRGLKCTKT